MSAARVMARLDMLAELTSETQALTRLYLTPSHHAAIEAVRGWMEEAGLQPSLDPAATLVGRRPAADPNAPMLLIGSHLDTVRDAGRYDGALGVVLAIEAMERLRGTALPFSVDVLAFGDEEGSRFPVTLTGSRTVAGTFDPASLDAHDLDDVTLGDALRRFGCDPDAIPAAARRPERTLAYLEAHIEQGPVLEAMGRPVGVVTAIAGASRFQVAVLGMAGHAGTVPMHLRRDALAGAAAMLLTIEGLAGRTPGLVATVGRIEARPGVGNVIPGEVRFSIDVRHAQDSVRAAAVRALESELRAIADTRGLRVEMGRSYDEPAVPCDPALIAAMQAAAGRCGVEAPLLPSGAGHDGLAMAALCPVAMLFVRCECGISHHPAESVDTADVAVALDVLTELVRSFPTLERRP